MSVSLSPPMFLQFFVPGTNAPAVGYQLFTYIAGTSTKQATWTDSTQVTQNANPVIADSNGVMIVWLDPTLTYKFVLAAKGDTDPPSSPIYSVDNISPFLTSAALTAALIGPILYPRTAAEIAASVTPSNYTYAPTPFIDARRYGFDTAASSATNVQGLKNAIAVATAAGGGTVQLPYGAFTCGAASDVIDIPQYVVVRGAGMRATMLTTGNDGNTGPLFRLGAASTGVLKYGCGLTDLGIVMTNVGGTAVRLLETCGASLKNLYIEGPINAVRFTTAVFIDGGNISSFFNLLENIICNHIHHGFDLMTSGSTGPTQTVFVDCTVLGDVATDTTSLGLTVRSGCGSGATWLGGNFESCQRGIQYQNNCQSMTVHGARFEGNTNDIEFQSTAGAQSIVGSLIDVDNLVLDNSSLNYHRFIACVNGSNRPAGDQEPGQMIKRAVVTGQAPLIIEGFPGDTTTETFILRNSTGQKLLSLTNQGVFARINNTTGGDSGWGTPTGTGVVANFPGASATLGQCSQAIAEIIRYMKVLGIFSA